MLFEYAQREKKKRKVFVLEESSGSRYGKRGRSRGWVFGVFCQRVTNGDVDRGINLVNSRMSSLFRNPRQYQQLFIYLFFSRSLVRINGTEKCQKELEISSLLFIYLFILYNYIYSFLYRNLNFNSLMKLHST